MIFLLSSLFQHGSADKDRIAQGEGKRKVVRDVIEVKTPREPKFYPNDILEELERQGITCKERGGNVVGKEKMVQIYEAMADITLAKLNEIKKDKGRFSAGEIEMISATLQLYNAISDSKQPGIFEE